MDNLTWITTCLIMGTSSIVAPVVVPIDWTHDIVCSLVAGSAGALTQYKLVIDKKVTTWFAIPFEIIMACVAGFILHAGVRTSVEDLRTLICMSFGIGLAGTPGLRMVLSRFLPEIYGAKK